ncbi:stage II sporulation protein M [Alicyclobacillus vulcanalis]|uniref:Stage II sporulation protein M n=1 Tax=Alicyclobacillus vulcanalis TaxID=252246 RepID=A0A1N7KLV6_9BACL|nr:stage II sporulation protein M [Alicyclobacillus vulcanalis]SIS62573.1 stage II sporulation protein M [Alicyclobacillus vulcanalis]
MKATAWVARRRSTTSPSLLWFRFRRYVARRASQEAHIVAFLLGMVLAGLAFGGVVAGELRPSDKLELANQLEAFLLATMHGQLASGSFVFANRLLSDAAWLGLVWLAGSSAVGIPIVAAAVFARAFETGFAVAFTALQFGWKGIVVASVGIFVHQAIFLFAYLVAGVNAIRFSYQIVAQSVPLYQWTVQFVRYTGRSAMCLGGVMLAAAIQAFVVPPMVSRLLGG